MTNYNTYTLSNGLRIIHLPTYSQVVYCGYEINAGTRNEPHGKEGLAHFCEHMSFKGTEHRRACHILNCLESVGGDLNAYTNKYETVYYASILHEHLGRAIDLLTDIVFHSTYPQREIDKEVGVICDEIDIYNDSPSDLIYDEFENMVFEGNDLGHFILGKADTVRSFKTADAMEFTKKYYRPDNAVFFVYGDVKFNNVVRLLEKATSGFPDCSPTIENVARNALKSPISSYKPREVVNDKKTNQAHVMIGNLTFDVFDKRRIPLYLLNNILGGPGMNTLLNVSLREHHGLVYTVESFMLNYGDIGTWGIYFGCDHKDIEKCRRLVRHELDKMMDTPLSNIQIAKAKKQIKGQIGVASDNRESFALDFGKVYLHYGMEKDTQELFKQIDAVTPEQLRQVANDLFPKEKLSTLIFK